MKHGSSVRPKTVDTRDDTTGICFARLQVGNALPLCVWWPELCSLLRDPMPLLFRPADGGAADEQQLDAVSEVSMF